MVSTHLKNFSHIGNLPQRGVKIKNIWVATTQESLPLWVSAGFREARDNKLSQKPCFNEPPAVDLITMRLSGSWVCYRLVRTKLAIQYMTCEFAIPKKQRFQAKRWKQLLNIRTGYQKKTNEPPNYPCQVQLFQIMIFWGVKWLWEITSVVW